MDPFLKMKDNSLLAKYDHMSLGFIWDLFSHKPVIKKPKCILFLEPVWLAIKGYNCCYKAIIVTTTNADSNLFKSFVKGFFYSRVSRFLTKYQYQMCIAELNF